MVSRLIALPVQKGDSFLLEQGERTLLVDGGEERCFVNLLSKNQKKLLMLSFALTMIRIIPMASFSC